MKLNESDVIKNKNEAIAQINEYLDNCLITDDKHLKKVNLISYWFKDYIKYISEEETFNSSHLKEYKRGDIIKANLGFNIGNEEGGLHYCIVLDKKNAKSYSTITVIPLSSQKENSKTRNTSVFLGDEIYQSLNSKNELLLKEKNENIIILREKLRNIKNLPTETEEQIIIKNFKVSELDKEITIQEANKEMIKKISQELKNMKSGTIALINQITTISKQRIYNPKKDFDILSGIHLSADKMNLIDEKMKKFFIN